jgi:hypothetical protein
VRVRKPCLVPRYLPIKLPTIMCYMPKIGLHASETGNTALDHRRRRFDMSSCKSTSIPSRVTTFSLAILTLIRAVSRVLVMDSTSSIPCRACRALLARVFLGLEYADALITSPTRAYAYKLAHVRDGDYPRECSSPISYRRPNDVPVMHLTDAQSLKYIPGQRCATNSICNNPAGQAPHYPPRHPPVPCTFALRPACALALSWTDIPLRNMPVC